MLQKISPIAFKLLLAVVGAVVVFTGFNRAFGGIRTLGWQGTTNFLQILSERDYLIQDSHTRFLGGVWAAIGIALLLAPLSLRAFRPVLYFIFVVIFVGGLARFTLMRPDITFGPDILGSLVSELVLMPVLAFWLSRIETPPAR